MGASSQFEDAMRRLEEAEHRLGYDPQQRQQADRQRRDALHELRTAVEAAEQETAARVQAAESAADQARRDIELETGVLREQYDRERQELNDAVDQERARLAQEHASTLARLESERIELEATLADSLRHHAAAMERDRRELEMYAQAHIEKRCAPLEDAIDRSILVLGEIDAQRFTRGRRLLGPDEVAQIRVLCEQLKEARNATTRTIKLST